MLWILGSRSVTSCHNPALTVERQASTSCWVYEYPLCDSNCALLVRGFPNAYDNALVCYPPGL